jgi:hypothetical protein
MRQVIEYEGLSDYESIYTDESLKEERVGCVENEIPIATPNNDLQWQKCLRSWKPLKAHVFKDGHYDKFTQQPASFGKSVSGQKPNDRRKRQQRKKKERNGWHPESEW